MANFVLLLSIEYRHLKVSIDQSSVNLAGARSRLYRRHILQVNIRWQALDELYKMYMLLHRLDLTISENFRQTFPHFSAIFAKKIVIFEFFSVILLRC